MDREELITGQLGDKPNKEANKSPLLSLEQDLKIYADSIKEVALDIINEEISTSPIFIAHQHEVSIGEMILNREELNTNWTIQVSTLEEFVQKGIIHPDKKENFIKNYKNPEKFICMFVITPQGANFIFYPYQN